MPDKKPQSKRARKSQSPRRPRITKNDVEAARITTNGVNLSKAIQSLRTVAVAFVICFFGVYKTVQAVSSNMAGEETSVAVAFLTDILSENWVVSVSISLHAIFSMTIFLQRKHFHRVKKELVEQIAQLEKHLDPGRTTSGLNPDGSHDLDD